MASEQNGGIPRLNELDTVPPPDGGDAYGNATVVRAAPSEILDAIRRERENESARDDVAKADASASAAKSELLKTPLASEAKVVVAAASPSESSDIHIPQGEEGSIPRMPLAIDPEALKPARLPQDFEKLMSQRSDGSLAGLPAQPPADERKQLSATRPSSSKARRERRTNIVLSVVVGVLILWIAILAALALSHFVSR